MTEGNVLYYGDNLDVMRRHIADESIDLVYLDPPFKSNVDYNVLFADHGTLSAAQIKAFEDTWQWDQSAAAAYDEVVSGGGRVADALVSFRRFLGDNDMLAYLSMMAPRLIELRRVLKSTGTLWLHCDPTASHYLKILLDSLFGPERFLNEVIWKRTSAHSDARQGAKHFGRISDSILLYSKTDSFTWTAGHISHDDEYVRSHYPHVEPETGRRYGLWDMTGPGGAAKGNPRYEVLGVTRYWRYSKANMERKVAEGKVIQPRPGAVPREVRYLDESQGAPLGDIWTDIPPINSQAKERLGYPTQKPEALLARIIAATSNEGDTVLDPFCGCGTTVAAAERLGRRWIGIDVTHLAIGLIKARMTDLYGDTVKFKVIGEPTTVEDAKSLAAADPYQFQFWALGLVGARPAQQKKGADRGIDGRLYFNEGLGSTKQIIFSVKAGHLSPSHVRDLRGVLDREVAEIGVLLSFETPTQPMRSEAAGAGFHQSPTWGKFPRLQLITVGELLAGKGIEYPRTRGANVTYRRAEPTELKVADQPNLGFGEEPD